MDYSDSARDAMPKSLLFHAKKTSIGYMLDYLLESEEFTVVGTLNL